MITPALKLVNSAAHVLNQHRLFLEKPESQTPGWKEYFNNSVSEVVDELIIRLKEIREAHK